MCGPGRVPAWHSGPGAWVTLGWQPLDRSVLNKTSPMWPTSGPTSEVSVDRLPEVWPHSAHTDTTRELVWASSPIQPVEPGTAS